MSEQRDPLSRQRFSQSRILEQTVNAELHGLAV
jgi:hypothetical protein